MVTKEELSKLAEVPGVYLMKDSLGNIIYVGKSKNLKNRVTQYFRKSKNRVPKIEEMVKVIDSFEYKVTDTELEALLLECHLIKKIKPRYNSQMKNDKRYNYIVIDMEEEYPRIQLSIDPKEGKAISLGPFNSLSQVEMTLEFIKDYFPVRKCNTAFRKDSSQCLNYNLRNCSGACRGEISRDEYLKHVAAIVRFLKGRDKEPLNFIKRKMEAASEELDFETAAMYRDYLAAVEFVIRKVKLINSSAVTNNLIAAERYSSAVKIFFITGNRLRTTLRLDNSLLASAEASEKLAKSLINSFKKRDKKENNISKQDIDEAQIIFSYIKAQKNKIVYKLVPDKCLAEATAEEFAAKFAGEFLGELV